MVVASAPDPVMARKVAELEFSDPKRTASWLQAACKNLDLMPRSQRMSPQTTSRKSRDDNQTSGDR
ncbi:MAG: hypothetical protein ACYCYO_10670 [Bacilli bacterium]